MTIMPWTDLQIYLAWWYSGWSVHFGSLDSIISYT